MRLESFLIALPKCEDFDPERSPRERRLVPIAACLLAGLVVSSPACHPITRERVQRALHFVAEIVASPGGEVYLPIFERLEAELAAIDRKTDALARARSFATFKSRSSPSTRRGV